MNNDKTIIAQSMVIGPFPINIPATISLSSQYNADLIPTLGGSWVPATTVGSYSDITMTFHFNHTQLDTFKSIKQAIQNLGGLVPIRCSQLMNLAYPYDGNPGIYYGLASNLPTVLFNDGTRNPDNNGAITMDEFRVKLNQQFNNALMSEGGLSFDGDMISFIQVHTSPIYNVGITLAITENQYVAVLRVQPAAINNEFGLHFLKNDEAVLHQELLNNLLTDQDYGRMTPHNQTMSDDLLKIIKLVDIKEYTRDLKSDTTKSNETSHRKDNQTHDENIPTHIKTITAQAYEYAKDPDLTRINPVPLVKNVRFSNNRFTNGSSKEYTENPMCDIYELSDNEKFGIIDKVNPDVAFNYRHGTQLHDSSYSKYTDKFQNIVLDYRYKDTVFVEDGDTINVKIHADDLHIIPKSDSNTQETALLFRLLGMDTLETLKYIYNETLSLRADIEFGHATRYLEYMAMHAAIEAKYPKKGIHYYAGSADETTGATFLSAYQTDVRSALKSSTYADIPKPTVSYVTATMATSLLNEMFLKSVAQGEWKVCKVKPKYPLLLLNPHVTTNGLRMVDNTRAAGNVCLGMPDYKEEVNEAGETVFRWTGTFSYTWISDAFTQLGFTLTGEKNNANPKLAVQTFELNDGDIHVKTTVNGYVYKYTVNRNIIALTKSGEGNLIIGENVLWHKDQDDAQELKYIKFDENDRDNLKLVCTYVAELMLKTRTDTSQYNAISNNVNKGDNLGTNITHSYTLNGKTPFYGYVVRRPSDGKSFFVVPSYFAIFGMIYFSNTQFVSRYFGKNKLSETQPNYLIDQNGYNTLFDYFGGYDIKTDLPKIQIAQTSYNTAVSHEMFMNAFDIDIPSKILTVNITVAKNDKSGRLFDSIRELKKNGSKDGDIFDSEVENAIIVLIGDYINANSTPYAELSEPFIKYCKVLNEEHYDTYVDDEDQFTDGEVEFVSDETYPIIECGQSMWKRTPKFGENDLSLEYLTPNLDAGDYVSEVTNAMTEILVESQQSLPTRDDVQQYQPYSSLLKTKFTENQIKNIYGDYAGRQHIALLDVYTDMNIPDPANQNVRVNHLMFESEIKHLKNVISLMDPNKHSFMMGKQDAVSEDIMAKNRAKYSLAVEQIKNRMGSRYAEMPFRLLPVSKILSAVYYKTPTLDNDKDISEDKATIANKITPKIVGRNFWYYAKTNKGDDDERVFLSELISRTIMTIMVVEATTEHNAPNSATGRYDQVVEITNKSIIDFADSLMRIFTNQVNTAIKGAMMSTVISVVSDQKADLPSCNVLSDVLKGINASLITEVNSKLEGALTDLTYSFMELLDINPFRRKIVHLINNNLTSVQQIITTYSNNNVTIQKQDSTDGFRYQHMGSDTEMATITVTTTDSALWAILLYIHKSQMAINKDYLAIKYNKNVNNPKYLNLSVDSLLKSSLDPYKKAANDVVKSGIAFNDRLSNIKNVNIKINNPFLNSIGFRHGLMNSATVEHDEETIGQGTIRLQFMKTTNKVNPLAMPKTYNKAMSKNFISNLLIMRGNDLFTSDLKSFIDGFQKQDVNANPTDGHSSRHNLFNKSAIITYTGALQSLFSISVVALVVYEVRKDPLLSSLFNFTSTLTKSDELNNGLKSEDIIEAFLFALVSTDPSESATLMHRLQDIVHDEISTINEIRKTLRLSAEQSLQQRSLINERFQEIIINSVATMKNEAMYSALVIPTDEVTYDQSVTVKSANVRSNEYDVFTSILTDCVSLLSSNGSYFTNYVYYTYMLNRYKFAVGQIHLQGYGVRTTYTPDNGSETKNQWVSYPQDNFERLIVLADYIHSLDPDNPVEQNIRTKMYDHNKDVGEYVNKIGNYFDQKYGSSTTAPATKSTDFTYPATPQSSDKSTRHATGKLVTSYYLGPITDEDKVKYDDEGIKIGSTKYEYRKMTFTVPVVYTPNMLRFLISFQGYLSSYGINSHKDFVELLVNNKFDDFLIRLNEYIDGVGLYSYTFDEGDDSIFNSIVQGRYNLSSMLESRNSNPEYNSFVTKTSALIRDIFVLLQPIAPVGVEYNLTEANKNKHLEKAMESSNSYVKRLKMYALCSGKYDLLVNEKLTYTPKEESADNKFRLTQDRIKYLGTYGTTSFENMYEMSLKFTYNNNARTDGHKRFQILEEYMTSKNIKNVIDNCMVYLPKNDNVNDRYYQNLNHITYAIDGEHKQMISMDTLMQHILGTYKTRRVNRKKTTNTSNQADNVAERELNLQDMSNVSSSLSLNEMFYANPLGIGHLIVSQLLKKVYSTHILPFMNTGSEISNSPIITRDVVTMISIAQKFGIYSSENNGSLGLGNITQNNLPTVQLFNNRTILEIANNSFFVLSKRFYYAVENALNDIKINTSPVFFTVYSNMHEFHTNFISKLSANQELNRVITQAISGSLNAEGGELVNEVDKFKISVMKSTYYDMVTSIIEQIDENVKQIYSVMRYGDGASDYKTSVFDMFDTSVTRLLDICQKRVFIINTIAYQDKASLNQIIQDRMVETFENMKKLDTTSLQSAFNLSSTASDLTTLKQIQKTLQEYDENGEASKASLTSFLKNFFVPNNSMVNIYKNINASNYDAIQMQLSENMQIEIKKIYEMAHRTITQDAGSESQYASLLAKTTNALLQNVQKLSYIYDRYILFSNFDEFSKQDSAWVGMTAIFRNMIENPPNTQFRQVITELFEINSMYETIQDSAFISELQVALANEKEFINTIQFPNHWFKAYPVQKVTFFQDSINGLLAFEDIFSFSNIRSINVLMDARHPVATARIDIIDPYNMLNNVYDKANFNSTSHLSPLELSPDLQENLYSMFVQIGTNVQIKLGYMNKLGDDSVIFNGKVTEKIPTEGGYEIVALNHASQLTTHEFKTPTHIVPSNTSMSAKIGDRIIERYLFSLYMLKPGAFWGVSGYNQFDSNFDGVSTNSMAFNKTIAKYRSNVGYIIKVKNASSWFANSGFTNEQKHIDFINKFLGMHNIIGEPDMRMMNNIKIERTFDWLMDRLMRAHQYIALPGETPWDVMFNLNMHLPRHLITTRPADLKDTVIWGKPENYYRINSHEAGSTINNDSLIQTLTIDSQEMIEPKNVQNRIYDLLELAMTWDLEDPDTFAKKSEILLVYRLLDYVSTNVIDPNGLSDSAIMTKSYSVLDLANVLALFVVSTNSINSPDLKDDTKPCSLILSLISYIAKLMDGYELYKGTRSASESIITLSMLNAETTSYDATKDDGEMVTELTNKYPYLMTMVQLSLIKLPKVEKSSTWDLTGPYPNPEIGINGGNTPTQDTKDTIEITRIKLENEALSKAMISYMTNFIDLLYITHPKYRQVSKKHQINNNHIIYNGITVQNNANAVMLFAPPDEMMLNTIVSHMGNAMKKLKTSHSPILQLAEVISAGATAPFTYLYDNLMMRFSQYTIDRPDMYHETEYPFEVKIAPKDKKTYVTKQPNIGAVKDYNVDEHKLYANKVMGNITREYYGGLITIEGMPNIFPHDELYINDIQNDMEGFVSVRSVTYIYDTTMGFVVGIEPSMKIEENDMENLHWGWVLFKAAFDLIDLGSLAGSIATGSVALVSALSKVKNPALHMLKNIAKSVVNSSKPFGVDSKTVHLIEKFNPTSWVNSVFVKSAKIVGVDVDKLALAMSNSPIKTVFTYVKGIGKSFLGKGSMKSRMTSSTTEFSKNKDTIIKKITKVLTDDTEFQSQDANLLFALHKSITQSKADPKLIPTREMFEDMLLSLTGDAKGSLTKKYDAINEAIENMPKQSDDIAKTIFGPTKNDNSVYDGFSEVDLQNGTLSHLMDGTPDVIVDIDFGFGPIDKWNKLKNLTDAEVKLIQTDNVDFIGNGLTLEKINQLTGNESIIEKFENIAVTYQKKGDNLTVMYTHTFNGESRSITKTFLKHEDDLQAIQTFNNKVNLSDELLDGVDLDDQMKLILKTNNSDAWNLVHLPKMDKIGAHALLPAAIVLNYKIRTLPLTKFKNMSKLLISIPYNSSGSKMYPLLMKNEPLLPNMKGVKKYDYDNYDFTAYYSWRVQTAVRKYFHGGNS